MAGKMRVGREIGIFDHSRSVGGWDVEVVSKGATIWGGILKLPF